MVTMTQKNLQGVTDENGRSRKAVTRRRLKGMMMSSLFFFKLTAILFPAAPNTEADVQPVCNSDSNIALHPSGVLQSCRLCADDRISGVACKGGAPIRFCKNGKLEEHVLSDDTTISGDKCKGDAPVYYYSDGGLISCLHPE